MNDTKKLLLIDPQSLSRLQTPAPATHSVSDLDQSMQGILGMPNLSDHDKWTMYNQQLQKYLFRLDETRKPLEIPLTSAGKAESVKPEKASVKTRVVQALPTKYSVKAGALYNFLLDSDHLGWDERGKMTLDGQPIVGANLVDVIGDCMRGLKDASPSWDVLRELKRMHVPRELVPNKGRWDQIQKLPQEGSGNVGVVPKRRAPPRQSYPTRRVERWERIRL